jgi:hypothetical protein
MSNVGDNTVLHSQEREMIYNLYKFILGEAKDGINFPSEDTGSGLLALIGFPSRYLREFLERERNLMQVYHLFQ